MTQHAGRVRDVAPIFVLERLQGELVPELRCLQRAPPVVVAHMQHMVDEVLELLVGRLRPFEIGIVMLQDNVAPGLGPRIAQMAQGVERQAMMRVLAGGGEQNSIQQRHAAPPCAR